MQGGFDESKSDESEEIVLAVAVVLIIVVFATLYARKRRSTTAGLRQRFGPEYEQAVREPGSERKAEPKLTDREKRTEKLNVCDPNPMERERFFGSLEVRTGTPLCR
jgi:hypothetical protein